MDVKKIAQKDNILKFLVRGVNAEFTNALRRTIMADVPILAIEDVSVYENSSILYDEFLTQRLALIPLTTDLKTYKKGESAKMSIEKEGPCTVYSKDIKCNDPKIEVADKRIPIVRLLKDQKLKLEMKAVMGLGKEHAKWQPAVVSYRQLATINVDKDCNLCGKCIENCAKKLLEAKAKKIVLETPLECDLCGKCRDVCNLRQLAIEYSKDDFLFMIESHGALENADIIEKAVQILEEKNSDFRKEIKKL